MATEWRRLGETVLRDLVNTAIDNRELLLAVASARRKLRVWLPLLRVIQEGANDIGDLPPLPSADLDRAVDELGRHRALHARAGRAFALYCGGVDAESLHQAELHHNAARPDAAKALRRLRAASAMARAFEDAVRTAQPLPRESLQFTRWMEAAYKLASHAVVTCTMVLEAVRRMRNSIGLEFLYVSTVLYGPHEQAAAM